MKDLPEDLEATYDHFSQKMKSVGHKFHHFPSFALIVAFPAFLQDISVDGNTLLWISGMKLTHGSCVGHSIGLMCRKRFFLYDLF